MSSCAVRWGTAEFAELVVGWQAGRLLSSCTRTVSACSEAPSSGGWTWRPASTSVPEVSHSGRQRGGSWVLACIMPGPPLASKGMQCPMASLTATLKQQCRRSVTHRRATGGDGTVEFEEFTWGRALHIPRAARRCQSAADEAGQQQQGQRRAGGVRHRRSHNAGALSAAAHVGKDCQCQRCHGNSARGGNRTPGMKDPKTRGKSP